MESACPGAAGCGRTRRVRQRRFPVSRSTERHPGKGLPLVHPVVAVNHDQLRMSDPRLRRGDVERVDRCSDVRKPPRDGRGTPTAARTRRRQPHTPQGRTPSRPRPTGGRVGKAPTRRAHHPPVRTRQQRPSIHRGTHPPAPPTSGGVGKRAGAAGGTPPASPQPPTAPQPPQGRSPSDPLQGAAGVGKRSHRRRAWRPPYPHPRFRAGSRPDVSGAAHDGNPRRFTLTVGS